VPLTTIDNIILVVGVFASMTYSFFTTSYSRYFKGNVSLMPQIGQWMMIIAFGSSFGNAVMGRISLLIGSVYRPQWQGLGVLLGAHPEEGPGRE